MKKIGIIGGLAWPSTLDYYRLLCSKTNEHFRAQGITAPFPTPPITIESLNINDTRKLRGKDGDEASWARFDEAFREAFGRLQQAGAELGIIASNTPHMRLKSIVRGLEFPIVSILDTTAEAVRAHGGKRALVLGTSVTMKSTVYPEVLQAYDIEAFPRLEDDEIAKLENLIDVELYQGEIGDARGRILALCKKYANKPASDVVCLACTELPLAFPEYQDATHFECDGISFVNTTAAHVDATLRESIG
jgi:aspartate racemase